MATPPPLRRVFPLYVVLFFGFVGYSLMITVFTPLLLSPDGPLLPATATASHRAIVLGALLCLYPAGQFLGSPVLGALSDRYGRRPVLLVSLTATTACYALIATALGLGSLPLLAASITLAGLGEANIVTAQSAVADVAPPEERARYFGYIYSAVSLAYIAGPLAGGKLAEPSVVSWFTPATPFWVVFALLALTAIYTRAAFAETRPALMVKLSLIALGAVAIVGALALLAVRRPPSAAGASRPAGLSRLIGEGETGAGRTS